MTAIMNVPKKTWRLANGSLGTEYDAVVEALTYWRKQQQEIEDKVEELQRWLEVAEGRPV